MSMSDNNETVRRYIQEHDDQITLGEIATATGLTVHAAALDDMKWLAHEKECEAAAMAVLRERKRTRPTR
jgi:hypothetical protein